jgi:hypothetical protein
MIDRRIYTIVNASTTLGAQTTNPQYVGDAKRVGVLLLRSAGASGNTVFTFKGAIDGIDGVTAPTMVPLNVMIDNVANTNVQQMTRIGSKTVSTVANDIVWLDEDAILSYLEIDYNSTTDGTVTIILVAEMDQ